jgi:competence protein ComEA
MRRPTLRCALIATGLLAIAGQSWAATGTPGTAGTASPASAASGPAATGQATSTPSKAAAAKAPVAKASAPAPLIDINSASRKQLKTLPGLSDEQIDKLIESRPYLSKGELVSKNVIPTGPYLSIRRLIIAKQPPQPKAKPKSP